MTATGNQIKNERQSLAVVDLVKDPGIIVVDLVKDPEESKKFQ